MREYQRHTPRTENELCGILHRFTGPVALDTETTDLSWYKLECEGISLAHAGMTPEAIWIPRDGNCHWQGMIDLLKKWIPTVKLLVMHNAPFDLGVLAKLDIWPSDNIFCTQTAAHHLNENKTKRLKEIARDLLRVNVMTYEEVKNLKRDDPKFIRYAQNDAIYTLEIMELFVPQLKAQGLDREFYGTEMPFQFVLRDMKIHGIRGNGPKAVEMLASLEKKIYDLHVKCLAAAGLEFTEQCDLLGHRYIETKWNLGSPDQLREIILNKLHLTIEHETKTGKPSTGKKTKSRLKNKHQFVELLDIYTKATKLKSTFLEPFTSWIDGDGQIRTDFNNTVTVTHRLSSSNPNLQNLAKDSKDLTMSVRDCFEARPGNVLITQDFSGQELRILAYLTKDPTLIKCFKNGLDLHLAAANLIFNLGITDFDLSEKSPAHAGIKDKYKTQRHIAKNGVLFPLIYGSSQPLTSHLLTPHGWIKMGDVNIGQVLYSEDGSETRVTGIFPQGIRPVYRITMKDGSIAECDEEHLWKIQTKDDRKLKRYRIRKLRDFKDHLTQGMEYQQNNCFIEYCNPIQFGTKEHIIPPYTMGLYLGDGSGRSGGFRLRIANDDTVSKIIQDLPETVKLSRKGSTIDYQVVSSQKRAVGNQGRFTSCNTFVNELRSLGLHHLKSPEKFIPSKYLLGDVHQRWELFKGLIDSDGSDNHNSYDFSVTSKPLADGFVFLVKSLGGRATIRKRKAPGPHMLGNQVIQGRRDFWRVLASFPPIAHRNSVEKVEYIGEKECQCVSVDHPSGLYITDDFMVTHNTARGVADSLNCTEEEAQSYIDSFFKAYPDVQKAMVKCRMFLEQHGYVVAIDGRRRRFTKEFGKYTNEAKRQAFNFLIQGSAAAMTKRAMVKLHRVLLRHPEWDAHIVLTVHDEITVECKKQYANVVKEVMRDCMITALPLGEIPLEVDGEIGFTYVESK